MKGLEWLKRESFRPEGRQGERGVALLIVLTMVVMFTAFVVDFGYNSRMRYTMASHARDAAKAEALAVSGLRVYQILLMFGDAAQGRMSGSIPPAFQGLLGSGSMVVRLIPVLDTGLLRMLAGGGGGYEFDDEFGEGEAPRAGASGQGTGPTRVDNPAPVERGSFLDFEGDFSVSAKEEATKISLNGIVKGGALESGAAQMLLQTLKKEQYQPYFRDANLMPEELVSNIIDWGDVNAERANGRGYEDNLYNSQEDPYLSKNAPYDSVSELHLVAGMNDDLFGIIAPLVTAHTVAEKISLPIANPQMLEGLIRFALPNHRFTDADMQQIWSDYQMNAFQLGFSLPDNAQALVTVLKMSSQLSALTIEKVSEVIETNKKKRPKVFTLTATGLVGEVERTVEVVVDISKNPHMGGLFLHWRED